MNYVSQILMLLMGLIFTLFGMNQMSHGLERLSGGKLERVLETATSTKSRFPIVGRIKGMLVGCGITALVQSSASTTVMTVGFVNSGMMKLEQAVGIIMGANIGTTITLWILALSGIEGTAWYLEIFKPANFAPVVAAFGLVLLLFSKKPRRRDIGSALVSFSIMIFGVTLMRTTCTEMHLEQSEVVMNIFASLQNPFLGVIVGALFTALVQSSTASISIVQVLAGAGVITYGSAIPIIVGTNIGTCVTAMISCIGANKSAKRTAVVHLYFNCIGCIVFLSLFYILKAIFGFDGLMNVELNAFTIAIIHTVFNVAGTLLMLPLGNQLARLATITIPDKPNAGAAPTTLLDDRFLNTPAFAVEQCSTVTDKMAHLAKHTIYDALSILDNWDEATAGAIIENEEHLDRYEDKLGTYLVKLSEQSLNQSESKRINQLLHVIGDFERIGDHALNILDSAREIKEKGLSFSPDARKELNVMIAALKDILELSFSSYFNNDVELAGRVEPLEDVIDALQLELKSRHVNRLQRGECTIQLGFVFNDLVANFERVSDHCSNIAVDLIEVTQAKFDTHRYLNALKQAPTDTYSAFVTEYTDKYSLQKDEPTLF